MRSAKKYWNQAFGGLDSRMAEIEDIQPSRVILDQFFQHAALSSGRVLDLGCGFGRNSVYLAERGFQVAGVDISPNAIEICKKRFGVKHVTGDFRVGTFNRIPHSKSVFDAVICMAAFDHITWPDAVNALKEIRRVLVPGGKILMTFDPVDTDRDRAHEAEILPDGTMKFITGDQKGMLFRPYTDVEVRDLIGEHNLEHFRTTDHGSRVVFCS